MKTKLTIIAAVSAGLFASAQAQSLVAGWDFSQFINSGFSSIDGATLTGQANANFVRHSEGSPLVGVGGVTTAPNFGVIYYDGSFGSSAFDLNSQLYNGSNDAGIFNSPGGSLGAGGQINTLVAQGQHFGFGQTMSIGQNRDGGSIVIAMDMTGYYDGNNAGTNWFLTYASRTNDNDGASTINWEYSLNGADYTFLETDAITSSLTGYTVDLSDAGETSQLFVRATFNGVDTNAMYFDNLHVNASPVPEPSAFAAIFGVVALGFAAVRRRRKA